MIYEIKIIYLFNKGGVSIRMDLYNTSVCFVNVHLAAHAEECERRNEDYDCITEKTLFSINPNIPPKYIKDHDQVYFFGDMNYRIQHHSNAQVRTLASTNKLKALLALDQLNGVCTIVLNVNTYFYHFMLETD